MTQTMKFGVATLAVSALAFAFAGTANAQCGDCDWGGSEEDNSVYISVSNSGSISNTTTATSNTGGNKAGGSYGGDGGTGGNGGNGGDADVDGGGFNWCGECGSGGSESAAAGGNGGTGGSAHGGDAGAGGYVDTGNATAEAGSANELNNVDVVVEGCGCEEDDNDCACIPPWFRRDVDNSVKIEVSNSGSISNTTEADADTGDNKAKGSYGGEGGEAGNGGNGGDATVGDEKERCGCEWDLGSSGDAVGGDAGQGGSADGGEGDIGGTVRTGDARSESGSINVMNTSVVRVVR